MSSPEVTTKDITRVYSVELYQSTSLELGGSGMGEASGIPYRSQEAIRRAIEMILGQMEVELESVLFSGYNLNEAHEKSYFNGLKPELVQITDEIMRLQDDGVFERQPELRSVYQRMLSELKGSGNLKSYYFSDYQGLSEAPEYSSNPIHYAGTRQGAVIAAYDRLTLQGLNQDRQGLTTVILASSGLIEAAKVLEFYPRFKI